MPADRNLTTNATLNAADALRRPYDCELTISTWKGMTRHFGRFRDPLAAYRGGMEAVKHPEHIVHDGGQITGFAVIHRPSGRVVTEELLSTDLDSLLNADFEHQTIHDLGSRLAFHAVLRNDRVAYPWMHAVSGEMVKKIRVEVARIANAALAEADAVAA